MLKHVLVTPCVLLPEAPRVSKHHREKQSIVHAVYGSNDQGTRNGDDEEGFQASKQAGSKPAGASKQTLPCAPVAESHFDIAKQRQSDL